MKHTFRLFAILLFSPLIWSCKKDDADNTTPTSANYALIIKSGGQSVNIGGKFSFEAQLVGANGAVIPITSGITYSSSNTSIATFSGTTVTGLESGTAIVSASYAYNGVTYTASVPIAVQVPQTVFAVNPWTIWWAADNTEFELNTIYFGQGSPTYTYSSSDATIASVSASGVVKALKAGNCVITVTASNLPGTPSVQVPVLLFGEITVPLSVTKVKISPGTWEMFKGEDKTFTAKAFNSAGTEVTGKTTKWSIKTTDSLGTGAAATIDQTGKVVALRVGEASVFAEIEGIVCQANITINPDFAILVEPFLASVGAGKTKTFTAKTYAVDRVKYHANPNDPTAISIVPNHSGLKWELPFASIPGFENPFTIESSNTTTCTIKVGSSALPGLPGFLLAYVEDDQYAAGGATILTALASDCDCGLDNPEVASISVASTTVTLNFLSGPTSFNINAVARNSSGVAVSTADVKYCSSNVIVASVDDNGVISSVSPGDATITVCVGNVKKEIQVTVEP